MALWSENAKNNYSYWRRLIRDPLSDAIRHESFFISDGGGERGIQIDYAEQRQAAQQLHTQVDITPD